MRSTMDFTVTRTKSGRYIAVRRGWVLARGTDYNKVVRKAVHRLIKLGS